MSLAGFCFVFVDSALYLLFWEMKRNLKSEDLIDHGGYKIKRKGRGRHLFNHTTAPAWPQTCNGKNSFIYRCCTQRNSHNLQTAIELQWKQKSETKLTASGLKDNQTHKSLNITLCSHTRQNKMHIFKENPLFQATNITKTNNERNEGTFCWSSWIYQLEFAPFSSM